MRLTHVLLAIVMATLVYAPDGDFYDDGGEDDDLVEEEGSRQEDVVEGPPMEEDVAEGQGEEEVAGPAIEVGECEIHPDPKMEVRPSVCCGVGDVLPIDFKEKFKLCEKTNPFVYQKSFGEDPWTNWVHHTACLDECIWGELRLLDSNNRVNERAVRSTFTYGLQGEVLLAVTIALDNCFAIYEKDLSVEAATANLDCRSGATELLGCYMREVFLNCPDNLFLTAKTECGTLWEKINNCPKIHVMLHKPSLPQQDTKKRSSKNKG